MEVLSYLAEGVERYMVKVHCYVLMENHLHLVATTPGGNLSKWMHQLKTAYTVYFNRRHQVVGHLFQGRFRSTAIEAEKYLLEVSRYLHLNPMRGMVLGHVLRPIVDAVVLVLVPPNKNSYASTMLDWNQCPTVERVPGKVSGVWLFKGTRVPVKALFENLEDGAGVDDFLRWFRA